MLLKSKPVEREEVRTFASYLREVVDRMDEDELAERRFHTCYDSSYWTVVGRWVVAHDGRCERFASQAEAERYAFHAAGIQYGDYCIVPEEVNGTKIYFAYCDHGFVHMSSIGKSQAMMAASDSFEEVCKRIEDRMASVGEFPSTWLEENYDCKEVNTVTAEVVWRVGFAERTIH
jgi:hypothetical protein